MPSVCMRAVMSLRERARRGLPRGGELRGQLAIALERLGLGFLERLEIVVGAVEFGEFVFQRRGAAGELGGWNAVLAAQFFDGREPALDFFLPRGIDVESFQVARQFPRRFANLDGGFVHHRNDLGEPLVDARQRLDSSEGARGRGVRVAIVGVVQQPDGRLRGFGEPAAIGMAGAFFGELRHFAFLQVERLELAHLEAEQFEARIAIASLAFEFRGAIHECDPDFVCFAHLVGELEVVAEIVEQFALRVRRGSATGIRAARGCRR